MTWRYAVGVGANLGRPLATFAEAAALIQADGTVVVERRSQVLVNRAIGGPPGQPDFHNAVWVVRTALGPHQLLHHLQRVEHACGRARSVRWGPRLLDLDLLCRDDGVRITSPVLTLPHPLIGLRPFVSRPLAEVWPGVCRE